MSDTADTGGEVLSCDEVVTTYYERETLAHFEEGLWREKGVGREERGRREGGKGEEERRKGGGGREERGRRKGGGGREERGRREGGKREKGGREGVKERVREEATNELSCGMLYGCIS